MDFQEINVLNAVHSIGDIVKLKMFVVTVIVQDNINLLEKELELVEKEKS